MKKPLLDNEKQEVHEIARVIDNLSASVFAGLATKDGTLIYANRQALDAVGASLTDVAGKPVAQTRWFVESEDGRRRIQRAISYAAHGVANGFEFSYRRADGRARDVDLWVKPAFDMDGNVEYLVISCYDITERKQIERLLGMTNEAVDRASVAVLQITSDGRIHSANESASNLLGYSRTTLRGMPISRVSKRASEVGWDQLWEKQKTGEPSKYEAVYYHADGRTIPVEVVASHIRHNDDDYLFAFVTDLSERTQADKHLHFLAHYDPLTGLPNRSNFINIVEKCLAEEKTAKVAVLIADLERFWSINQSLGRAAGDQVLVETAERFLHYSDGQNRFARVGPDQFGIVMTGIEKLEEVESRIASKMNDCFGKPFYVAGHQVRVAAKFGIAIFPDAGSDAETLCRGAEAALLRAKEASEPYASYARGMFAGETRRLRQENRLRLALERQEFVLHYQPKVCGQSGLIVGLEALLRWNDAEEGMVLPGVFIGLLEQTGMIAEVGAWVLRQAIYDYKAWKSMGLNVPRIAVNISAVQLRRRDFVESLKRQLGADQGKACIELEITESVLMEDIEENIKKLQGVRSMGFEIAIDDFGTGYSSLSYLTKLPLQTVKVDRSFIATMLEEPARLTMVSAIISLSHALGLRVIAEGVENQAQAARLRELKCDEMQGYLFGKPMPAAELFEILRSSTSC